MPNTISRGTATTLLLALGAAPLGAFACATCGCSLSSDAAMGYSSQTGWHLSLQYDFINQNRLRIGTRAVDAAEVAAVNDAGGAQEVERQTLNRYVTLGIGYAPNLDWNVRLLVPYIERTHSTYGQASNPLTPDQLSASTVHALGDVKLIVSYQGLLEDNSLGVQLGVKAPTGRYGGPNADGSSAVGRRPVAFDAGPVAGNPSPGNLLDTSLQPGTGSTDLIVGGYYHRFVTSNMNAFVNGQFQAALAHRLNRSGEDFRPGNTTTVSVGVRYEANPSLIPQLQVNVFRKSRDQGALADNPDSAGTVAYLSPGISVTLPGDVQAFGFVQLPIYRRLEGYQVAASWTASVGLSRAF